MDVTQKNDIYRIGVGVLILLAVLTIGEYFLGSVAPTWWPPLIVIGLIKAFFIIRDYMHLPRLFAGEEEGHQ
ncbi:MAG TPA: cytochrome C oxidase subunit IV family protein [Anaerolineales bacterium]